jgi:dihydropyrimidinase
VRSGRITIEQLVQLVSSNPARIFGLYPRKGVIEVGSDADLCILDPSKSLVLPPSPLHSASNFEIYAGREVWGWPRYTVSRGDVVLAEDTMLAAAGRGRFVAGKPAGTPLPGVHTPS